MSAILPAHTHSLAPLLEGLETLSETSQASSIGIWSDDGIGINLLLVFSPKTLIFFSEHLEQLAYFQLLKELIGISDTHEELISRLFCRSISRFIKEGKPLLPFSQMYLREARFSDSNHVLRGRLNPFTQWAYLDNPYEERLLEETLNRLSYSGKMSYEKFLSRYLPGCVLLGNERCRRLLPCWPLTEKIPYDEDRFLAKNAFHELEPNTCTFFFGHGWLTHTRTFQAVKQRLLQAQVQFKLAEEVNHTEMEILFTDSELHSIHRKILLIFPSGNSSFLES